MIVVLLGPPGAGKGTQANIICKSKDLFHFSTGDILRNEVKKSSEIGKKIEKIINAGQLVGDDIIIQIVEKIISEKIVNNKGILFDGFPRNLDQAKAFEDLLKKKNKDIDYVIHLIIDKNETSPLIDLYKKKNILKPIDGMQSVEKVSQNIEVELN